MTSSQTMVTPAASGAVHAAPFARRRVFDNPATGDRLTILRSAGESGGAAALVRFDLPPGAAGSPLHYHASFSERFTVTGGALEMTVGRRRRIRTLRAGESVRIRARVPHSFRNASGEPVTFTAEATPARGFERFVRAWYGLAADGRVNRRGVPRNPLHLALCVEHADLVFVGAPRFAQRFVVGALTLAARLTGADRALHVYYAHDDTEKF